MTFNHDTLVEACDAGEGEHIPQVQFNFIPISEIANRTANTVCDVIGVVKSTSDMQTIIGKASQKEFTKRDVLLVDEKASISVALWGKQVRMIVPKNRF
jgi:replication factor A1